MIWYGYLLSQIVAGILTLWMLIIAYFFIKRRYTQSSVAYQNSTEESDIYANSENVFNESSSESLSLDHEKKTDMNNVTECSGYDSTEDEMQENKNYTKTQNVLETCKFNSDSHSSIISWESCKEEIFHSELDFVNCLSSEICQPINLCMRDLKNETGTNKITRTFFTDRKHKSIKNIQKINSKKDSAAKMSEDSDQRSSSDYEKLKNLDYFENTKHSLNNEKLEYNLDNKEHELKNENKLEITELSSTHHEELEYGYSMDNTEHELNEENNLEITKLSSTHHEELEYGYSMDSTEHELNEENNLEITKLSSINDDEYTFNNTEPSLVHHEELEDSHSLDNTEISSINHDEYSFSNTEHELKNKNKLEITKLSSINHDEYGFNNTENKLKNENDLEIMELSSIHCEELEGGHSLINTEHSSYDDDVMLANNLETTGLSPIHHDEQNDEYNYLKSPELSSLNNDKSISGIGSPNIKCHHDYEVHDINGFNNTSSSECTESFPSPIFNDSSIDDIRYVEDYNDISFFDSTISDDAMNEAFIVEEI